MNAPAFLRVAPSSTAAHPLSARIKWMAREHGLNVAGITTADTFDDLAPILERHIDAGHVAGFDWFTAERARFSTEPRNLQASARSLLTVGVPYWNGPAEMPGDVPRGRISRYAWGNDYHAVLKRRMVALHGAIEREAGHPVEARFLVDTARIVDRAAAARAGIGWYGKHSCLIAPGHGSWVMLGSMLLDLELQPDTPLDRNCGRCAICIDRCPTGAIVAPYTISSPKCISFQTIEQRGPIPRDLRPLMSDWVFGCDVCQEVCPYTGAAAAVDDPDFRPANVERVFPRLEWLLRMTEAEFREMYRGSAVLRAKRRGLARNAAIALGNTGDDATIPALATALAEHDEPLVRGHVAWALGRIGGTRALRAIERARTLECDPLASREIVQTLEEAF